MQWMHCPGQRTHRPIPHRALARDLTDCPIRSRDPPAKTMVQFCLVTKEVWDDIPQAIITHLSPLMSLTCRVVHEAHGLPEPWLTLLHLMVCCTEQNATIDFCLTMDDSRQVAVLTHTKQCLWAVFTIIVFPVEINVRYIFVEYIYCNMFLQAQLTTCNHWFK